MVFHYSLVPEYELVRIVPQQETAGHVVHGFQQPVMVPLGVFLGLLLLGHINQYAILHNGTVAPFTRITFGLKPARSAIWSVDRYFEIEWLHVFGGLFQVCLEFLLKISANRLNELSCVLRDFFSGKAGDFENAGADVRKRNLAIG